MEESLNKVLKTEAFAKLKKMFPNINFESEIKSNPELADYLRSAINSIAHTLDDPLKKPDAPKLNEDFSKYFLLNNLPKVDEAKAKKLSLLLVKLLQKKNISISEEDIQMPINKETKLTDGCAFVQLSSEESAKFAAAILNGYQLDKHHMLAASQINDFERIMHTAEKIDIPKTASLLDLRSTLLDTKREQYLYQSGKDVILKWHDHGSVVNRMGDSDPSDMAVCDHSIQSDKPVSWSPKGTYLIIIKHDKIDFLGGPNMEPIITLPEPKVDSVSMSPCERYVMTYAPMSKNPYIVWNFQLVEQIREFDQKEGETSQTYQWSHDGNYIAKQFKQDVTATKDDGSEEVVKTKTGVSVYTLPSMELLVNEENVKKSITIDGIIDFQWAPHQNFFVYTSFPGEKIHPRIGFMDIPSRKNISLHTIINAQSFRIYFHPQGDFLAVMCEYKEKKTTKYSVELFNTKKNSLPHQKILISREVLEFHGAYWEPNHNKLAIHTLSKRQVEAGKRDYTLDPQRNGVDIYEMVDDPLKGFTFKTIGFLNSEKTVGFNWSGSGDIFNIFEYEGSKTSVSFYMIIQDTHTPQTEKPQQQKNKLQSLEEKYEFKKFARHDVFESKYTALWDQSGRYLAIYGTRRSTLDKSDKSIKFYNIFGEPLGHYDKIPALALFKWRPRPSGILKAKDIQQLKKDYKTKYHKKFQEEEIQEKKEVGAIVKSSKKKIRDEFFNDFFLPLRNEFEKKKDKYEALWPIKKDDYLKEPVTFEIIYSYDNVITERKI